MKIHLQKYNYFSKKNSSPKKNGIIPTKFSPHFLPFSRQRRQNREISKYTKHLRIINNLA